MLANKTLIHFLYLIALLVSCGAYQPCSFLNTSNPISLKTLSSLNESCSFQSYDNFEIQISSESLKNLRENSQITIGLSGSVNTIQFAIFRGLDKNEFILKSIDDDTNETFNITISKGELIFSIQKGEYSIFLETNNPIVSKHLKEHFSYILTIETLGDSSTKKKFAFEKMSENRFLSQCPEGLFLVDGVCARVCPEKYYRENGLCWKCINNCGRCLSETKCNPCQWNEVYFNDTCYNSCPAGYFEDLNNGICVRCTEGCSACSFPNGLCSASYFKTDMIINLALSAALFCIIVFCACFCNREKQETEKLTENEQQPQQGGVNPTIKAKGNSQHIKEIIGEKPEGQYNQMAEEYESEEEKSQLSLRRRRNKLTEFAQSKLLSVNLSKKPFTVDDSNDDQAISHDSATKLFSRLHSPSLLSTKTENSPFFKTPLHLTRKGSNINSQNLSGVEGTPDKLLNLNLDDYESQISQRLVSSPLAVKKESSLGLMAKKINIEVNIGSNLVLQEEDEMAEGDIAETTEGEKELKEGYKPDLSLSISRDQDTLGDLSSCTICSMNTKDCINKPCGHVVACYACMKQFSESYGVCPRCKILLTGLEKTFKNAGKKKK